MHTSCTCSHNDKNIHRHTPHTKDTNRELIIDHKVTGETFRGEEREALNNECLEPCYMARQAFEMT